MQLPLEAASHQPSCPAQATLRHEALEQVDRHLASEVIVIQYLIISWVLSSHKVTVGTAHANAEPRPGASPSALLRPLQVLD